jgi:DNA-binding SARP family transcriptional activator
MFGGKSAAPLPDRVLHQPVLEQAADEGVTLLEAPAGYLFTAGLAAALEDHERPTVWLRAGPEDGDPAVFLLSLIAAAQRVRPEIGAVTSARMRRNPGPIGGWPGLFACLGREFAEALPTASGLVVEDIHRLNVGSPTLELFGTYLLPALPASTTCTLTSRAHVARAGLPRSIHRRTDRDLRLDVGAAQTFTDNAGAGLSSTCIRRAVAVTEGRAVALAGLNEASTALGHEVVDQAVRRAHSPRELLARIARASLVTVDADDLQALAIAVRLGYSHPDLMKTATGGDPRSDGPWFQPLADDWALVQPTWLAPLRAVLPPRSKPDPDTLLRAADLLRAQGALEQALPVYLDLGETERASRAIERSLDPLMSSGRWDTVEGWISRLPRAALRTRPWLLYAGAEIALTRGDDARAETAFASATTLFHERRDLEGMCQSMLAESALAAWHGDVDHGLSRALAANAVADANGLTQLQGWAGWQVGCLTAGRGDLDEALAHFARAEAALYEAGSVTGELLQLARDLTLRQRELRDARDRHLNDYYTAERSEREVAERVRALLSSPPESALGIPQTVGWLRTPLALKLPSGLLPASHPEPPNRSGLWATFVGTVGLRPRRAAPAARIGQSTPETSSGIAPGRILETSSASTDAPDDPRPSTADESGSGPTLTAHLLGHLRVTLNDRPVESWPSGRGKALLEYLLAGGDEPVPRDVLMELLWPEADPEAARNNLNVGMHGLRKALRTAAEIPVVVYQKGAYLLDPALDVWIDVREFEGHVRAARRLEATGDLATAAGEYELALALYQGDFLADDPYEAWPVLIRESLRVSYLDTLDRLSQIYFGQGVYNSCEMMCQLILARDACREDAHCRLMRCYSRQHQDHLALRQYQVCVDALHGELGIDPTQATTQLFERIRRRERV